MKFSKMAECYLFNFFCLGQSAFNPRDQPNKNGSWEKIILHFVPTVVLCVLTSSLSYGLYVRRLHLCSQAEKNFLDFIWFLLEQALAGTIAISSMRMYNILPVTYVRLRLIERACRRKMKAVVDVHALDRAYKRKVWLLLGIFGITLLGKLRLTSTRTAFIETCLHMIQTIVVVVPVLHTLFYISVFGCFQKTLSDHVAEIAKRKIACCNNGDIISRKLVQCRQIHYQLWSCIDFFNEHFGWTLVLISSYYIYYIMWSIFNIFYTIYVGGFQQEIQRNWFACFRVKFICVWFLVFSSFRGLLSLTFQRCGTK